MICGRYVGEAWAMNMHKITETLCLYGAPDRIRTCGLCLRRAIACLTFPARSATVRFLSPPDHRNLTCILGETWAVTP